MLTAVAGISARYSKCSFVLFCYITNHLMTGPLGNSKHLMTGPEGNSEFCFPRISMFPETKSRETLRFEGKCREVWRALKKLELLSAAPRAIRALQTSRVHP